MSEGLSALHHLADTAEAGGGDDSVTISRRELTRLLRTVEQVTDERDKIKRGVDAALGHIRLAHDQNVTVLLERIEMALSNSIGERQDVQIETLPDG